MTRILAIAAVGLGLGACAGPAERSVRPEALSKVQPTKPPFQLARTHAVHNGAAAATTTMAAIAMPSPAKPAMPVDLPPTLDAKVVTPDKRLQCVPYARALSNIEIYGDAWTWWEQAAGSYRRGKAPHPGAVLVLQPRQQSLGHVAHVDEIVDSRTILVSHANWLNEGRLHNRTPVKDVSAANDWSEVRFWHTPGGHFGGTVYKPYGFIYGGQQYASR